MALCPSCVPTPQPGRPLQPFPTARGEAGSWGGSPGASSACKQHRQGRLGGVGTRGHKRQASSTRGRNGSEGQCSCQGQGWRLLLYRANIRGRGEGLCSRGFRVQGIFYRDSDAPRLLVHQLGILPLDDAHWGEGMCPGHGAGHHQASGPSLLAQRCHKPKWCLSLQPLSAPLPPCGHIFPSVPKVGTSSGVAPVL